jgi:hypothetical protein
MSRGAAINSYLYLQALKPLQKRFRSAGHYSKVAEIFLQHNKTQPHTSFKTPEAITKLG